MSNKPSGDVIFLFTDIEGSTQLSQDFPELIQAALERHNTILQNVIDSNNGFVFEIVGDAFCCAFEKAEDAVKAAVDAQVNLSKEKSATAGQAGSNAHINIKIRIGIHSGKAEWNGKRYIGYITLAKTARIMSAAYGEQILISSDAYELAMRNHSTAISYRDLGERRLKNLNQPVRLYQIISDKLREDFPPLDTLDARPNNLPVQLTSFIGREKEISRVKQLLNQTHLLTLTGTGGAGKTRLALKIAADAIDDFANGVWLVELASISEPSLLTQAVMNVLGLREESERNSKDTLCDYLRDKEILIILDNCEHLIEQCAVLTELLLSSSPKLKIIATSREAMGCKGEHTHRVLSLEVPDPKDENSPEKISQYEAVKLFTERASTVDENFSITGTNAQALSGICFQLDGIPLAIELAAARIKVLSVEAIYERLKDRFSLLTGGKRTALPRQQSLRALLDWSYDLLSEKEKIIWQRLTVFAGGWTLNSAEKICSDENIKENEVLDFLHSLTEKSIIIFESDKERYSIQETIRQYGCEKLKGANEYGKIRNKHTLFFMKFADIPEPKRSDAEHSNWLKRLHQERWNLHAGLSWLNNNEGTAEGLRFKVTMGMWHTIKKSLTM